MVMIECGRMTMDCSLSVENGTHNYTHGDTEQTWSYTIKDNKFDGTWVIFHSNLL